MQIDQASTIFLHLPCAQPDSGSRLPQKRFLAALNGERRDSDRINIPSSYPVDPVNLVLYSLSLPTQSSEDPEKISVHPSDAGVMDYLSNGLGELARQDPLSNTPTLQHSNPFTHASQWSSGCFQFCLAKGNNAESSVCIFSTTPLQHKHD